MARDREDSFKRNVTEQRSKLNELIKLGLKEKLIKTIRGREKLVAMTSCLEKSWVGRALILRYQGAS